MVNMNEITITGLQDMLRNKTISVKELVQEYISRIKQLDAGGNGLNSVIEVNPEALEIAEGLDRRGNENDLLLYGVPILIKDNIDTADQMHTSAGSLALAGSYASADAELVKILRSKGAIILGKTNMTEFANYTTQNMPNGYSSRGGQVKNPYNKEKDPSGSSSGSAVAVAANLCAASIGSDTCNSIVAPGLTNGVVGLRPTTGVISQKGIIPISFTLDTAGPFTRSVADAAVMYSGLTGNALIQATTEGLKGMTIGYNEWVNEDLPKEVNTKTEAAIKELERAGATIKRIVIPKTKNIMDLMKYEFKYALNQYLKTLPESYPIRSLKDVIEFNKQNPEKAIRYGQTYLLDAEDNTSGTMSEDVYKEILKDRVESMIKIREQIRDFDLCIMLSYNNILQYTALPVLTIPCGLYEDGMPFGMQLTASTDATLLGNSYAVEQAIGRRVEPQIR
ncbi:MAG: amidase family protein [Mobilitalea sp.]